MDEIEEVTDEARERVAASLRLVGCTCETLEMHYPCHGPRVFVGDFRLPCVHHEPKCSYIRFRQRKWN
jgi:hypothetical protein